ncbi:MAG: hypothetical protein ISS78_08150 [Phycisphaerae bacterium]|nr:hypothetical protein [Phycisphaerae bacterium]
MDNESQLGFLIDLAESLGIQVRQVSREVDSAENRGGDLVRLKGKEILFIDPGASAVEQIAVVAGALRDRQEIAEMYLPPQVRRALERA